MDSGRDTSLNTRTMNFSDSAVAYLKPVSTAQGKGFAIYTADGSQLAVFATREAAFFAARQHDLEPVAVH